MRFTVEPGSNLPEDYFATMMEELVTQLNKTHRFEQVLREGEKPADNGQVLELTGTITRFNRGNRTVRYMVGFGAGKTKIVSHVKFVDTATGAVQFEKNVDGKVWIGFMGGESQPGGRPRRDAHGSQVATAGSTSPHAVVHQCHRIGLLDCRDRLP